jgi:hypothetical protein
MYILHYLHGFQHHLARDEKARLTQPNVHFTLPTWVSAPLHTPNSTKCTFYVTYMGFCTTSHA